MTRTLGRIPVGVRRGAAGGEIAFVEWRGERPGPIVAITANIHGDETTGVAALHRLDRALATVALAGTVVLYPSCNPLGLEGGSRLVPGDDVDLNRMFPGSPRGAYPARLASALWRDLCARRPDLVVDLHADSPRSIPYVIIDRPVRHVAGGRRELAGRIARLADATGVTVLREYPDELYVQLGLDRSLAGAVVNLLGTPALTLEVGPRRYVDARAVDDMVGALMGVLGSAASLVAPTKQHPTRVPGIWRRAGGSRVKKAGILQPDIGPGAVFQRGDRLATLVSATGEVVEEVVAASTGVVVSWIEATWVAAGAVVGTLGVPEEES